MNVSVVDLSANQKKLQVEIPADLVRKEFDDKYRELARRVRIKGFRPGKTPKAILKSYYGKAVEHEVSSDFINKTFPDALKKADLKPLVEADVSETRFDEDSGAFIYEAVVDVCPPFEVEGYKGLKVSRPASGDIDEMEKAELDRMREQNGQLRTIEEDRPIKEGDVALVDFTPYLDGEVFERGKAEGQMVEIGKHALHPDFDQNLVGHKAGESLSFELDYPEDSPTKEIAGKRVRFEVTIKEIKEKELPELDDEFAKEVAKFDSLEIMKNAIRDRLQKQEERRVSTEVRQQITDQLLGKAEFELSPKVIEREVDRMIGSLQQQFESQGLKVDASRFNTPEIRAEYRQMAEKNLRQSLVLRQIAKQENVELNEEELDEIYKQIALYARMDVQQVKEEYADSEFVEQSKEGKIQEKVLKMLEETANYDEAAETSQSEA